MFNPNRDQARQFFVTAWKKHRDITPLTPLENLAVEWIMQHPEYHTILENPESLHRDFPVEEGKINPFLHLSMHLAITEQLSIDQPPGIRACYKTLRQRHTEHDAFHQIMDCLGEIVWESQRLGRPFSNEAYLELLRKKSARPQ